MFFGRISPERSKARLFSRVSFMRFLIVFFISMFLTSPVMSEVFRWTDNEGRVHFGDQPPEQARGLEQVDILPGPSDEQILQAKELAGQREAAVRQMEQERLQREAEAAAKLAEAEQKSASEKTENTEKTPEKGQKTTDSGDFKEICPSGLVRNGECISRGPVNLPAYNKPNVVRPKPIIIPAN